MTPDWLAFGVALAVVVAIVVACIWAGSHTPPARAGRYRDEVPDDEIEIGDGK